MAKVRGVYPARCAVVASAACVALATAAVLALSGCPARPADYFAESDAQYRAAEYRFRRDRALDAVRMVNYALGCGVLQSESAALGIENYFVTPLYSPLSGADAVSEQERQQLEPLVRGARQDGAERAKSPGLCDWFRRRPDVVRALRWAQDAGVH